MTYTISTPPPVGIEISLRANANQEFEVLHVLLERPDTSHQFIHEMVHIVLTPAIDLSDARPRVPFRRGNRGVSVLTQLYGNDGLLSFVASKCCIAQLDLL